VSIGVAQRAIALAAVALLAVLGALALAHARSGESSGEAQQVTVAETSWYTALAGSRGAPRDAERTTCRRVLTGRSLGVSHPVLPCGAKLFISYGGVEVLTEVIDNGMKRSGRQFELTESLAQRLGIEGTQEIRWRFARPADDS
jgi:hypothetical protein